MRPTILITSLALLFGGVFANAQSNSSVEAIVPASFTAQQAAYSPSDIRTLGTLNSGQTSKLVAYSGSPRYRAFVFEGNGHDRVEITVTGTTRNAVIALADSTLMPVAQGVGRLSAVLPYHGPDTEAFYILFKTSGNRPARLAVHFRKIPASAPAPDATR